MWNGEFRFVLLNILNIRKRKTSVCSASNTSFAQRCFLPVLCFGNRERELQILEMTFFMLTHTAAFSTLLWIFQDVRRWQETIGGFDSFSEGSSRRFPFRKAEIKRQWKETIIPSTYCSMKPMRLNVLTAFRRVNIVHLLWRKPWGSTDTWYTLRNTDEMTQCLLSDLITFTPVCFNYVLFTFLIGLYRNGSNMQTCVVSHCFAGCRFTCRNASYNLTLACLLSCRQSACLSLFLRYDFT